MKKITKNKKCCKTFESDRFKHIQNFVFEHRKRDNLELEKQLFKIVGNFDLNKYIDLNRRNIILKEFMNSLTQDEINSNLYLKIAMSFIETSVVDCKLIIDQLKNHLELIKNNQILTINIMIPQKTLNMLPKFINNMVEISFDDIIDDEIKTIYIEYNEYVANVYNLMTDIYRLQINNLLSSYPEQIDNLYFIISNNNWKHEFVTSFFIKKDLETSVVPEIKQCQLSEKAKQNISRIIGLPFDQIVSMKADDLEKYIQQMYNNADINNKPAYQKKM